MVENNVLKSNKTLIEPYNQRVSYGKSNQKLSKSERFMIGIGEWLAFYRSRPDIFVEDYLGISLKPFQRVLLYAMIHYNYSMFLASRGLGKTFLTAIYCVVRCILYPGTKIVVASKTKEQAMTLIAEKIPELMQISKTGMLEREIDGDIKTSMNTPDPNVVFLNGSWIKVVPANQNARSKRCNVLILDEFRMIDPDIYKNVLRRFLAVSRQPGYLRNDNYKNRPDLMERNQEIFLSSCYFKFNWSYSRYKTFINSMMDGRKYFVCGFPYQVAIKEGLTNPEQLMDELREDDIDEIGWEMEMNAMFYGESEKAFFKTEELNKIRISKQAIFPKDYYDFIKDKKHHYIGKEANEIRCLCCDISMINDKANDASIYTLMQLTPLYRKINNENVLSGYKRKFLYMESYSGGHTELQAIRIRQLYEDLDCDYIVLDRQGNGIGVYDSLCKNLYDAERGVEYKAFCSMNEDKLKERCLVINAEEKIYTMSATAEINSNIALSFKDDIKKGKVEFLISKNDSDEIFENIKDFQKLPIETKMKFLIVYKQFDVLVNEMVLLEGERQDNGQIRVKEKRSERKDRYTSVSYGNSFADVLEKELLSNDNTQIDWSNAPKFSSVLNL